MTAGDPAWKCGESRHRRLAHVCTDRDHAGDDSGSVERASVDSDSRVIASAKRVATRATTDPAVVEIDVDETHFMPTVPIRFAAIEAAARDQTAATTQCSCDVGSPVVSLSDRNAIRSRVNRSGSSQCNA